MRTRLLSTLLVSMLAYGCGMRILFAKDECIPGREPNCVVSRVVGGCGYCPGEFDYKSTNSDQPVRIQFINATNTHIKVYWLDPEGQRILYHILKKGESHLYRTYVTHPWVITTGEGTCLRLYLPTTDPDQFVTITNPARINPARANPTRPN
jgi:von Hippel-Lindau disease tumor suppressor protein